MEGFAKGRRRLKRGGKPAIMEGQSKIHDKGAHGEGYNEATNYVKQICGALRGWPRAGEDLLCIISYYSPPCVERWRGLGNACGDTLQACATSLLTALPDLRAGLSLPGLPA